MANVFLIHSEKILLINAQDYDVNLSCWKYLGDTKLEMMRESSGGLWGSVTMFESAKEILRQIFTDEVIDEFERTHGFDWDDQLDIFNDRQADFTGDRRFNMKLAQNWD